MPANIFDMVPEDITIVIFHQKYIVGTHLNHLIEVIQMCTHNICFNACEARAWHLNVFNNSS